MKLTNLKINQISEPIGYAADHLSLSWLVEEPGEAQSMTTAEVTVSDENGTVLYESGPDAQADSLDFALPVRALPRRAYKVQLKVNADNGETATGETFFENGKMDEAWAGEWIAASLPDEIQPILFKTFVSAGSSAKDRLYISGLGVYEAYLNGKKIGDEYLAPGYHSYDFHVQTNVYRLDGLLKEGENELRIMLGDGWFRGRLGFDGGFKNLYGDRCCVIAELYQEDQLIVKTDESWHSMASPVLQSSIYDGEVYDARLETELNKAPEDRETAPVRVEAPARCGNRTDRYNLPIVKKEAFPVKEILFTPKEEVVLHFGQNLTGWVEFDADLPVGEKIVLTASEIMQDDCFYHDNLRTAVTEFVYISNGTPEHARPHFTFYGFQYMKLERFDEEGKQRKGTPEEIMKGLTDITAWHLRSDFDQIGFIQTGNEKVDKLFSNALWGQKDNFLDVPTDCPQRDERLGWTGDAQVFSETACYNMYVPAFYRKYLWDMKAEMSITDGSTPNVVPRIKEGMVAECGNCPWADAAVVIPWNTYLHYGSKTLLAECYPVMKAWVDFSRKREEAEGAPHLIKSGFHFADWLALDNPQPGPFGATDPLYIASAYYYQDASRVAQAARILGYEEDAAEYESLAAEILKALQEKYFDEDGLCVCNTQTGAALSLIFGLVPDPSKKGMQGEILNRLVKENDDHLNTGFVGTPILCPALTEGGHNDTAMSLLLNEEYPGWLNTVNLGATTIWERWNSVEADGHLNPEGMNSLNHYSYGSIEAWMYGYICGIRPMEAGFKKAILAPHPDQRLGRAACRLQTAAGIYRSEWHYDENGKVHYEIEIPFDASAQVTIDGNTQILKAGCYNF